jgi:hypothetical protein
MKRIEEFSRDGKNFVYIDYSGITSHSEFLKIAGEIEAVIAKYPEKSLYTITNVENVRFDSHSKEIVRKYMEFNKPYVKYGVVIGLDGIKKMLVTAVMKLSGRTNMHFAFSKECAIEWLLKYDSQQGAQ